jgi:hypothetical protein
MSGVWSKPPVSYTIELSDSIKSYDAISSSSFFSRTLQDSLRALELMQKSSTYIRSIFDFTKIADSIVHVQSFIRVLTDSSKITDSITYSLSHVKGIYDSIAVSDYISKIPCKALIDVGRTYDYNAISTIKHFIDSLKVIDVTAKSPVKSLVDAYGGFDYISKMTIKSITDSYRGMDWVVKGISKQLIDIGIFLDWYEKSIIHTRYLVDSLKISDLMYKGVGKTFVETPKVADYIAKSMSKSLMDAFITVDELVKSLVKAYVWSWTLWYGRTYQEWIDEKAKRLWNALNYFYIKKMPIDTQYLLHTVYRERLWDFKKYSWKPIDEHLTNHKPSPFMKSFINYLLERLVEDGYLMYGWIVECHDRIRVSDAYTPLEAEKFRIYSVELYHKVVEVNDCLRIVDSKLEYMPNPVKITRVPMHITVELRDSIYIDDVNAGFEAIDIPPETKTKYMRGLIRMPSIEYLKDLCTWKNT